MATATTWRPSVGRLVRRTAYGLGGTVAVGGTALGAYAIGTESGLGWRREMRFWGRVAPVVLDYWWHVSSSSPRVKLEEYLRNGEEKANANESNPNQNPVPLEEENHATAEARKQEELLEQITGEELREGSGDSPSSGDEDNSEAAQRSNDRAATFRDLHARNAPKIFAILLELGGLYIKLGQVLSVTALPVPTEYRTLFRTLQSSVPGHEEFETVIRPTLEAAFGRPIDQVFESIEEIPCGAASIGQAHRAKLRTGAPSEAGISGNNNDNDNDANENSGSIDVIVKVQYPDAQWQVPADIQCVGDFLKVCVYFGVVDETSAKLSYEEFSRQFLAELDYNREAQNLREVYRSSLDPTAPYQKRGVEIPRVFSEWCTDKVITMTYLPGPKFEEEARKQLQALGIDTSRGIQAVVREDDAKNGPTTSTPRNRGTSSWVQNVAETIGTMVGVDNLLFVVRFMRQALLWSTAAAVQTIQRCFSWKIPIVSKQQWLVEWAKHHENATSQAEMLDWTSDAIDALFDVHGYQIFHEGLFNADAHPGNILVIRDGDDDDKNDESSQTQRRRKRNGRPNLGLIDYGQCKRLTVPEREKVARLVLSVANHEPDEVVASRCRELGFVTKHDSTKFLATFARLMFGKFRREHLRPSWHKALHEEDEIVYFPSELSMVYRTALLLRGLAMSFQLNVSVGDQWRTHAQAALDRCNEEQQRAVGFQIDQR